MAVFICSKKIAKNTTVIATKKELTANNHLVLAPTYCMRNLVLCTLSFFFFLNAANAQIKGSISGSVKDKNTQQPIANATITIFENDSTAMITDKDGLFTMEVAVGKYNVYITAVGYQPLSFFNININSGAQRFIQAEMEASYNTLQEVVVRSGKSVRATDMITPLSTQKLTSEEILMNPGGNFDISKVIQVLPGVAGSFSASRNDIIVRGGGPSENVYYLDGIEIPVLNHFQTQGASGGATGILNSAFINDVQLTSSAFNSRYDNALASTFVIRQRNGNAQKHSGNFRLSGSEFAAAMDGPINKNTTYLASVRRSYLKYLFQLVGTPIRPDYWDFQYKINHKPTNKTDISFIGLGAIDDFFLAKPKKQKPETEYLNRSNPLINQWNYTVGVSIKRLIDDGYYTIAVSRNMFSNGIKRYENNIDKSGRLLFESSSFESENKLRIDVDKMRNGWKYSVGAALQYVKYEADVFNTVQLEVKDANGNTVQPAKTVQTHNNIGFYKTGFYAHLSRYFLSDKLLLSGGFRSDMNSFTENGMDPLATLSPRLSASYSVSEKINISASVGSYFKLPPYTALGYLNNNRYTNRSLNYINAIHYTAGLQYLPRNDFRVTAEAFYKDYSSYPVSAQTGISLANLGTDFNAIGNEPYHSTGKGRVYGMEVYAQQKMIRNLFYVASATVYKSEFAGADEKYVSSTWDYGYIVSATVGLSLKKNWEIGLKYRIAGGQPYTPYDLAASRAYYLTTGKGVYDYSLLNSERLKPFQQLDLRVDKKYNFRKTSLTLYLDFQNISASKTPSTPKYTFERNADNTAFITTDGNPIATDGSNAIPIILSNADATIVPAIGFIWEF